MNQFVVDASIVLSWVQDGNKKTDPLWILQDKLAKGKISLLAPDFLLVEVLNVLKWRFKVSRDDALSFLTSLPQLPIQFVDSNFGDMSTAIALVYHHQLSAYDALYLGLAKKTGCMLISLDKQLLAIPEYVKNPTQIISDLGVQ